MEVAAEQDRTRRVEALLRRCRRDSSLIFFFFFFFDVGALTGPVLSGFGCRQPARGLALAKEF